MRNSDSCNRFHDSFSLPRRAVNIVYLLPFLLSTIISCLDGADSRKNFLLRAELMFLADPRFCPPIQIWLFPVNYLDPVASCNKRLARSLGEQEFTLKQIKQSVTFEFSDLER